MKENNNFTESFRSKFESIKNGSINRIAIEAQQLMNGESIDEVKPTALDEYNDLLKGMDNNKSISKEELSQLSSYQIKNFSDNSLSPE